MGEMDFGIWVTRECLILSDEMGCQWEKNVLEKEQIVNVLEQKSLQLSR